MKKVFLLCALVCAGQMYGMEKMGTFGELPEELHQEIVRALLNSKDLDQVIDAIKVASVLRGVRYDDLADFTKLVHALADKFNKPTIFVARKFNTPTAKKYIDLSIALLFIPSSTFNNVAQLIKDGADVNFTGNNYATPLSQAIQFRVNIEKIKLLLDSGANPNFKNSCGSVSDFMQQVDAENASKQLIEEAIKKPSLRSTSYGGHRKNNL